MSPNPKVFPHLWKYLIHRRNIAKMNAIIKYGENLFN